MILDHIGDYEVLDRVGEGAHAYVHAAIDTTAGTHVALKVLREPLSDRDAWQRCADELASLARLRNHPNVVTTYRAGIFESETGERHAYIAMELLAESLADSIMRGPLALEHVLHVGLQISAALAAAHAADILHRDVKPSNILLRDAYAPPNHPMPKLADFGIARLRPTGQTHDSPATPEFAAPEVRAGGPASPQSDVYGLGVTLLTAASGRVPMTAPAAHDLRVGFPGEFEALLRKSLEPNPADRPSTALAVSQALTEVREVMGLRASEIDVAPRRRIPREPIADPDITAPTRTSDVRPPTPPVRGAELLFQPEQSMRSPKTAWIVTGSVAFIVVSIAATALLVISGVLSGNTETPPSAPTARATGIEAAAVDELRLLSSGGFAFKWTDPNGTGTYLSGFQVLRDGTAESVELIPFDQDVHGQPVNEQVVADYPDRSGGTSDVTPDGHDYCVIVRLQPVLVNGDDVEPALPVDSEPKCLNSRT